MVGAGNEITEKQSRNLSGKTEKNQEKTSVSTPRFEWGTYCMQVRNAIA
jgi:hypothetical protein